jgi:hypothetical protein
MTAAQIRDAARLVGADATAENCLHRTGEVAEVWVAGFIAGLEAAMAAADRAQGSMDNDDEEVGRLEVELRLKIQLGAAREAAETVGKP